MKYLILLALWSVYFVIHSLTASTRSKKYASSWMGKYFRYYRALYTVVSIVLIFPVLNFQRSMHSPWLLHSLLLYYFGIFLSIAGLILGAISLYSYGRLFDGMTSLFFAAEPGPLQRKGVHQYVRHPLYSATLLLIWGYFMMRPQVHILETAGLLTSYILLGIRFEEKKLIALYGQSYLEYQAEVPSLIPAIFRRQ